MKTDITDLYKECWKELEQIHAKYPDLLEREATPVLFFGDYKSAQVITAGLNPSEREFRENGIPLTKDLRRFLHRSEVDSGMNEGLIEEAFKRSTDYFKKNPYKTWFRNYDNFLKGLKTPFEDGLCCHTDYFSPFATFSGLSDVDKKTAEKVLYRFGLNVWRKMVEEVTNAKIIFGHGRGHDQMPKLFNFTSWEVLTPPFPKKLTPTNPFLFKRVTLNDGRTIGLYWWKQNLNGHPLTQLTNDERTQLGSYIASHSET